MTTFLKSYDDLIDFNRQSLAIAAVSIVFNPIFWNSVARMGILRDLLFERALREQPTLLLLSTPVFRVFSYLLLAIGNTLVLASMWALGFTGTFLGDYFGILKDDMVTGFPFNITDAPMYYGSTLNFLGIAIYYGKPAGIILTFEILIVYLLALRYEDPFTMEIYNKRERERKTARGKEN
ncbi:Phosphatidyl-N-methylethanolamine N-methyltransferase [Erysiphe neolycopersici]|uniref:Phosphatidyl-N-methylethanolamine N-methyltransferase n=1 Tax=Erysiphe neolycopersici TaxID=212602 RepID=A0A420HPF6_9PEZI|nr:Phosphatidyl-N-methylethanolamine N-methyltransferase [Erysiphe neolycopersici]